MTEKAPARRANRTRPPPLGSPPPLQLPPLERHRLANGLDVLVATRRGLPLVDARLVVRAGAAADGPGQAGLAALTADLLEEGTASRTGVQIAEALDALGAELSVRAGWDDTTAALHVLRPRLAQAVELVADIVCGAAFLPGEVRRRRDERLAALLQERDEPAAVAAKAVAAVVYGADHPYGRPVRGWRRTVAALGREDLYRFHAVQYRPDHAFLVAVGDVDLTELVPLLERAFGAWPAGAPPAPPPPPVPAAAPDGVYLVSRPGAPQSEFRVARAGAARATPDYAGLLVVNSIFGGAFTSRLNLRLREEKGYTYGARSSFAFRAGAGPFVAGAAVFTDNTADAVADTLAVMRRMCEEPVPADELERTRRYLALGLPRRLETGAALAAQLAELHLYGLGAAELEDFAERVHAITPQDVLRLARQYLDPDGLTVVAVGDAAATAAPLEALGRGPVRPLQLED
jgi:zinc protease